MQRKWQVFAIVCGGSFVASLDLFIVNVAFPDLQRDFAGSSLGTLSWVLNAYTIVFAALLVPAGRAADAIGRRRVFLSGLALFALASAACAAAPSVGTLVAARVVQAVGAALLVPTSLGLLLPAFPAQERQMAVAGWAAVGAVAAAAGPVLGGLLVELSWHWVFLVNVPVIAVALVAGARVLDEIAEPQAARPDVLGAVLLALGVGALVAGLVQGDDWGWGNARTVASFVAAATLVGTTAWRSLSHPAPVVEPELLRVRRFSVAVAGAVVFFAAFSAMLLSGILFLTGAWGSGVLEAGLQIAPGPAMAAIFSIPGARLSARIGMAAVGVLGTTLFALAGLFWLTQLEATPDWLTTFLPGMLLSGAGVGLTIPTLTAAAATALPPERFATGIAVATMGRQLGLAIGVAVLVALLGTPDSAADFDAAWAFIAIVPLGAGLLLTRLGAPVRQAEPEPATV